jgi:uncharacterized phiE125 gp8 family phage protein
MIGNVVVRTGPAAEPVTLTEAKLHCRAYADQTDEDALITSLISAARAQVESETNRAMVTRALRSTFHCWPDRIYLRAPLRKVTSITYRDTADATQTLAAADYVVDLAELPGVVVPAYAAVWPSTYEHPAAVSVDFIAGAATAFTIVADTDVLTAAGHPIANGDVIRLWNSGGALPAGLAANTNYYAVNVSGDTLQLSATSGGAAVNATGAGTGTHFLIAADQDDAWHAMRQAMLLLIDHWYEHRSDVSDFQQHKVPRAVDCLLAPHRVWSL